MVAVRANIEFSPDREYEVCAFGAQNDYGEPGAHDVIAQTLVINDHRDPIFVPSVMFEITQDELPVGGVSRFDPYVVGGWASLVGPPDLVRFDRYLSALSGCEPWAMARFFRVW